MKKPRPTKADRDIADYLRGLPLGKYVIDVREDTKAVLKPEGGLVINHDGRNITIARSGLTRVTAIIPPAVPPHQVVKAAWFEGDIVSRATVIHWTDDWRCMEEWRHVMGEAAAITCDERERYFEYQQVTAERHSLALATIQLREKITSAIQAVADVDCVHWRVLPEFQQFDKMNTGETAWKGYARFAVIPKLEGESK